MKKETDFQTAMANINECTSQYIDGLLNESETINMITFQLSHFISIEPIVDASLKQTGKYKIHMRNVTDTY